MKTKLSIVRCSSYLPGEIKTAVGSAFELLGGISSFVEKREKVLIKPNLLSLRPPEEGVNTHIEIVRAVVRLVKECGAVPVIGDNPGGSVSPKDVYSSSGILAIAKEEDIELREIKNVRVVCGMPIASYFFECDKIISLPKMKTHNLMVLTGAVKNMYGAVTGLNKSEYHKRFPNPEEFVNVVVDVFSAVRPHLVLMDGIVAMDGDGPVAGRLREVRLLIASEDSVAIDSVFSHLIGIDPLGILTTKEAYKRGLGEADIKKIEILGEPLEKSIIQGFKLPRTSLRMKLPGRLLKLLAMLVKFAPSIDVRLCKRCKVCEESCPVSAISIDKAVSIINYKRCIRCMCCNEVCPYGAVRLKRNVFARVMGL